MDRSTSFSSSGDLSRSASFIRPHSSASDAPEISSALLAHLESNTSALGHVGLLKHQREALRHQLQQQYLVNKKQAQSSSTLRKLALRLSVQISLREARLKNLAEALSRSRLTQYLSERDYDANVKQLLEVLKTYERHGEDIIRALDEDEVAASKSTFRDLKKHVALLTVVELPEQFGAYQRPFTPPESPFSSRSSNRAPTPSDFFSKANSRHLPSEVLEVCLQRIKELVKNHQLSLDSINGLKESERALQDAVRDHEDKYRELEISKESLSADLERKLSQISDVRRDLEQSQNAIRDLEATQSSTTGDIQALQANVQSLESSEREYQQRIESLRADIDKLQVENETIQSKVSELQSTKDSLHDAVKELEDELATLKFAGREADRTIAVKEERLTKLQEDLRQNQITLEESEKAKSEADDAFRATKKDLESRLEASITARQETVEHLALAEKKLDEAQSENSRLHEVLQDERDAIVVLSTSEQELQSKVHDLEHQITRLDSEKRQLESDLSSAKDLLANFEESEKLLKDDIDVQKQRVSDLEEKEMSLKVAIADYEAKISALERSEHSLKEGLRVEKAEHGITTDALSKLETQMKEAAEALQAAKAQHSEQLAALALTETTIKEELEKERARGEESASSITSLETALRELNATAGSATEKHAAKVKQLEETNISLYSSFNSIQLELQQLSASATEKDVELAAAKSKVVALEESLKKAEIAASEAVAQCTTLQRSRNSVQQELTNAQSDLKELSEKKQVTDSNLEGAKQRILKLETALKEEQKAAAKISAEHNSEAQQARETNDKLQQELNEARFQLQDLTMSRDSLGSEVTAAKAKIADLQSEIENSTLALSHATAESAGRETLAKKSHDKLRQDLDRACGEVQVISQSKSSIESERDALQKRVVGLEAVLEESQSASQRARIEHESRIEELQLQHSALQDQILASETKVQKLSESRTVTETELNSARRNIAQLQNAMEASSISADRVASEHAESIKDFQSAQNDLLQQLEDVQQDLAKVSSERSSLQLSLRELEMSSQQSAEIYEGQIRALEETHTNLRSQLEDAQGSNSRLQKSHNALSDRVTVITSDMELVKQSKSEMQLALESERAKTASLESQLDQKKSRISDLEGEIHEMRINLREAKVHIQRLEGVKIELEADLAVTRQRRDSLGEDLRELKVYQATLEEGLSQNKITRENFEREMEEMTLSNLSLKEQLNKTHSELTTALKSSDHFKLSSNSAEARVEELQRQLTSLEARLVDISQLELQGQDKAAAVEAQRVQTEHRLEIVQVELSNLQIVHDRIVSKVSFLESAETELQADLQTEKRELERAKVENQLKHRELADLHEKNVKIAAELAAKEDIEANLLLRIDGLESQLAIEQTKSANLQADCQQLNSTNASLVEKIKRGQQLRASYEAGLGAIRIRLGVSTMSRRRVQSKLETVEKELASLKKHNAELEASLVSATAEHNAITSSAPDDEPEQTNILDEFRSKINELTEQRDQNVERAKILQTTMATLTESLNNANDDIAQLKQDAATKSKALEVANDEIQTLKLEVFNLQTKHSDHLKLLLDKSVEIEELQASKIDSIKRLEAELQRLSEANASYPGILLAKEDKIKDLQQSRQDLSDESTKLKAALQDTKSQLADMALEVEMLQSQSAETRMDVEDKVRAKDTEIGELKADLEKSRRVAESFAKTSREFEADVIAKESQTEKLRKLNKDYAAILTNLQGEISELKEEKAALQKTIESLLKKNAELELFSDTQTERADTVSEVASEEDLISTVAGQSRRTTLVSHASQSPRNTIISTASGPSQRPLLSSTDKRVASTHSIVSQHSLKPYQILGVEAAAGRHTEQGEGTGELKKKLWELWEEQRGRATASPAPESVDQGGSYFGGASTITRRTSKKLQKKSAEHWAREKEKIWSLVKFARSSRRVDRAD